MPAVSFPDLSGPKFRVHLSLPPPAFLVLQGFVPPGYPIPQPRLVAAQAAAGMGLNADVPFPAPTSLLQDLSFSFATPPETQITVHALGGVGPAGAPCLTPCHPRPASHSLDKSTGLQWRHPKLLSIHSAEPSLTPFLLCLKLCLPQWAVVINK